MPPCLRFQIAKDDTRRHGTVAMAGELCVVTYGCLHHHHAAILIPSVISLLSLYRVCRKRALFNHVLSAAAAEKNKNKITR